MHGKTHSRCEGMLLLLLLLLSHLAWLGEVVHMPRYCRSGLTLCEIVYRSTSPTESLIRCASCCHVNCKRYLCRCQRGSLAMLRLQPAGVADSLVGAPWRLDDSRSTRVSSPAKEELPPSRAKKGSAAPILRTLRGTISRERFSSLQNNRWQRNNRRDDSTRCLSALQTQHKHVSYQQRLCGDPGQLSGNTLALLEHFVLVYLRRLDAVGDEVLPSGLTVSHLCGVQARAYTCKVEYSMHL
jgi:hypothetical protein